LSLQLVTNTGAVFGIGKGAQGMFAVVSIVATVVIVFVFLRSDRGAWVQQTALALILAGALGNLHDRIRFSAVRDMLWLFPDVKLPFGLAWPGGNPYLYPWRFNIADAALVVGVGVMLILMWRAEKHEKQTQQQHETSLQ
jgi:signal peptidase II